MPVTDWRLGRLGYEERALEGVEFELRSDVTRTIEFKTAAGQWESKASLGARDSARGMGFHPAVRLTTTRFPETVEESFHEDA